MIWYFYFTCRLPITPLRSIEVNCHVGCIRLLSMLSWSCHICSIPLLRLARFLWYVGSGPARKFIEAYWPSLWQSYDRQRYVLDDILRHWSAYGCHYVLLWLLENESVIVVTFHQSKHIATEYSESRMFTYWYGCVHRCNNCARRSIISVCNSWYCIVLIIILTRCPQERCGNVHTNNEIWNYESQARFLFLLSWLFLCHKGTDNLRYETTDHIPYIATTSVNFKQPVDSHSNHFRRKLKLGIHQTYTSTIAWGAWCDMTCYALNGFLRFIGLLLSVLEDDFTVTRPLSWSIAPCSLSVIICVSSVLEESASSRDLVCLAEVSITAVGKLADFSCNGCTLWHKNSKESWECIEAHHGQMSHPLSSLRINLFHWL